MKHWTRTLYKTKYKTKLRKSFFSRPIQSHRLQLLSGFDGQSE